MGSHNKTRAKIRFRDHAVPEDFLIALRSGIPGFRDLSSEYQAKMALLILLEDGQARAHKVYENCISLSWLELERAFGRGGFRLINDNLKIFDVSPYYSKDDHYTRGYKLTELVSMVKDQYLDSIASSCATPTRMVSANGQVIGTLPNAISSKDSAGITATVWNGIQIPGRIPVSIPELQRLQFYLRSMLQVGQLPFGKDKDQLDLMVRSIGVLLRLANTDTAGTGFVGQRYVEVSTGRLFATGESVSVQGASREVRQAALQGFWDYDFENCHFSIFNQMVERFGGPECFAIQNYLDFKVSIREGIARRVGITVDEAKRCLISLIYGAKLSVWYKNAIPEILDSGKKARILYKDPDFAAIANEIDAGRKLIVTAYCDQSGRGVIHNAVGKPIGKPTQGNGAGKKTPRVTSEQLLAHVIQGVEVQALRAILQKYPENVVLPIHDGFVARTRLDVKSIETTVLATTGFQLLLSEKKMAADSLYALPVSFPKRQILRNPSGTRFSEDFISHSC